MWWHFDAGRTFITNVVCLHEDMHFACGIYHYGTTGVAYVTSFSQFPCSIYERSETTTKKTSTVFALCADIIRWHHFLFVELSVCVCEISLAQKSVELSSCINTLHAN